MKTERSLTILNQRIIACRKCARLVRWRERVAREKRRAFRDWEYWGRPAPGFGDPGAELLVLGLAPAAHGTNRTGRMFTGDRSGDFLYARLYEAGFASQPTSVSRDDGLRLRDCYITAALRCAPPGNKPTPEEQANCRPYLEEEFRILRRVRAVLALGQIAHRAFLSPLKDAGRIESFAEYPFGHGASYEVPHLASARDTVRLFDSYHPSQQNTQTGRLTAEMFRRVLKEIRKYLRG
ncbi:MAG: uracil-DNA glycosylase [Candidatus Acidiferrales bacterium]